MAMVSVLLVTAVVGGVALAAGEGFLSPFPLVSKTATLQVANPFIYTNFWSTTGKFSVLEAENGVPANLWPGDIVANGGITIKNVSPNVYRVYFHTEPVSVGGDIWPQFDTVFISGGTEYRPGQLIIPAGSTITLDVRVTVSYGNLPSTPFKGLQLFIEPASFFPPTIQPEVG
ncbi:MAG: hypothetical protein Q7R46_01610 [bacterium]|nr:hypothetical protein [bacterium]